jgi:hypothetical protein
MSTLREQFEAWLKIDQPHMFAYNPMLFNDDKVLRKMWWAYQAGHAASGRDELLEALEGVCKSIECYEAEQSDFSPDDEYDDMMFPKWENALLAIKKARGNT